jgi:CRISPR system Cascade subunit CasC
MNEKKEKILIEFHLLQNHAASNLNRDDTGSVKDVIFGGVPRARISSQCLKRSIRKSEVFYDYLEKEKLGLRTKYLPQKLKEIMIEQKFDNIEVEIVSDIFMSIAGGSGDIRNDKKLSSQLIFLSLENIRSIIDFYKILTKVEDNKKSIETIKKNLNDYYEKKKNDNDKDGIKKSKEKYDKSLKELSDEFLKGMKDYIEKNSTIPVDVALFGRMTTEQPVKDVNCSCQVAHAFSINKHKKEFDYFTAVDDLSENYSEDPGAGHLGETEFTSACFYKYMSVDFDSLVKHLKDDRNLAINAVCGLLKASCFANPSGKQNSFASHTLPHFVGIEIKDKKIPVNYCNAFSDPVEKDLIEKSSEKITEHALKMREAYKLPIKNQTVFKTTEKGNEFGDVQKTIDDLEKWLKDKLK